MLLYMHWLLDQWGHNEEFRYSSKGRITVMTKILGLMTCFNRKDKTINSIKKLKENRDLEFSFIVADDNSKDGTKETLSSIENVTVLEGNGNLFYSGGMRLAIAEALKCKDIDYVLLFNDDVEFYDDAIADLVRKAQNEHCVWVGPTCDTEGELSYGGVIKKSRWRPSFEIIKADNEEGYKCDTFNANCVLIPWDLFQALGNMDSFYSHSLGDFDYGFQVNKKGFSAKVSDKYVGVCCDNPTKGGWRDTSLPKKERLKLKESPKGLPRKEWFYYLKKNYSMVTAIIYSLIPYVRILINK